MRIKGSIAKGLLIALALALVPIAATSAQKISPGSTCKVLKQKVSSQNKVYTCIKSGKKFIWNKGVIAVGADADFVVLDQNPLKVAPEKVSEIKILQVYVAGVKA